MKGFVPTPVEVVDLMVDKLFASRLPMKDDLIIDPGCGNGAFIEGILRYCSRHSIDVPNVIGIEQEPGKYACAKDLFRTSDTVQLIQGDFLLDGLPEADYIIANPPYVPITKISEEEKACYRSIYRTASGRFDLYLLFYERALSLLKKGGRLVFITPEKWLYVHTAKSLRVLLSEVDVEEILLIDENTFPNLVTYPMITTVNKSKGRTTRLIRRNGTSSEVTLSKDGSSWLPHLEGKPGVEDGAKLKDLCKRISCGVATGADGVFVMKKERLPSELAPFAFPTVSGREINPRTGEYSVSSIMLIPYDRDGNLLSLGSMPTLAKFLNGPARKAKLMKRTCVRRKPWYSFHENPPMADILNPKIICKDISQTAVFVEDREGTIVPRHSVYYLILKDRSMTNEVLEYLNSSDVQSWLSANAQRAANGFLRLQSKILQKLPVPDALLKKINAYKYYLDESVKQDVPE
jgi:adenine-specific DNA-methyltransferase